MPSSVLDRIPTMERSQLKTLLENARARPNLPGATAVIAAVEAVLKPKEPARLSKKASLTDEERKRIRERWADEPLVDRLVAAFRERPPSESQVKRLLMVHEHPDLDEERLVDLAGDKGAGGFNLVLGSLAFGWLDYLPPPDAFKANGEPNWSSVICHLRKRTDAVGRVTHGWNLKAETVEAMRRVGILPR